MTSIDWSNAPHWAQAVVASPHSNDLYWVEGWGCRNSKRQRMGALQPDLNTCDMTSQDHAWRLVERRPVADEPKEPVTQWNGQGLPPVGVEVEIAPSTPYLHIRYPEGARVKVYANFTDDRGIELAAFVDGAGQVGGVATAECFLPIQTPEQIAAQQREKAVQDMLAEVVLREGPAANHRGTLAVIEALYDAGYRRVEGTKL